MLADYIIAYVADIFEAGLVEWKSGAITHMYYNYELGALLFSIKRASSLLPYLSIASISTYPTNAEAVGSGSRHARSTIRLRTSQYKAAYRAGREHGMSEP